MIPTKDTIVQGMKTMREQSVKRKFDQSVDLSIILTGLDLKKPQSKITADVILPHGIGEPRKVLVFGDGELGRLAKSAGADLVMNKADVEDLQGDKKRVKKLADAYDMTLAQTDFMVQIGKILGPVLGPRGKMPKPIPTTANPAPFIERLKKTVTVMSKAQMSVHGRVGKESMPDEKLVDNAMAVMEEVDRKVTVAGGSIKAVYLKTSMGKPVKLEVPR
jgi:large subunit ribosomal protein L1